MDLQHYIDNVCLKNNDICFPWFNQQAQNAWAERIQRETRAQVTHHNIVKMHPEVFNPSQAFSQALSQVSSTAAASLKESQVNLKSYSKKSKPSKSRRNLSRCQSRNASDIQSLVQSVAAPSELYGRGSSVGQGPKISKGSDGYSMVSKSGAQLHRKLTKKKDQAFNSMTTAARSSIRRQKKYKTTKHRERLATNEDLKEECDVFDNLPTLQDEPETKEEEPKAKQLLKKMQQRNPHIVSSGSLKRELYYEEKLNRLNELKEQNKALATQGPPLQPITKGRYSVNGGCGLAPNKPLAGNISKGTLAIRPKSGCEKRNRNARKTSNFIGGDEENPNFSTFQAKARYLHAVDRMKKNEAWEEQLFDNQLNQLNQPAEIIQHGPIKPSSPNFFFQKDPNKINNQEVDLNDPVIIQASPPKKKTVKKIINEYALEKRSLASEDLQFRTFNEHLKPKKNLPDGPALMSTTKHQIKCFNPFDQLDSFKKKPTLKKELLSALDSQSQEPKSPGHRVELKTKASIQRERAREGDRQSSINGSSQRSLRLQYLHKLKSVNRSSRFNEDLKADCQKSEIKSRRGRLSQHALGSSAAVNVPSQRLSISGSVKRRMDDEATSGKKSLKSQARKLTADVLSRLSKNHDGFSRKAPLSGASRSVRSTAAGTGVAAFKFEAEEQEKIRQVVAERLTDMEDDQLLELQEYFAIEHDFAQEEGEDVPGDRDRLVQALTDKMLEEIQQANQPKDELLSNSQDSVCIRDLLKQQARALIENPYTDYKSGGGVSQMHRRTSPLGQSEDRSNLTRELASLQEKVINEKLDRIFLEQEIERLKQSEEQLEPIQANSPTHDKLSRASRKPRSKAGSQSMALATRQLTSKDFSSHHRRNPYSIEKGDSGSTMMAAKMERARKNKQAYLRQASLDKLQAHQVRQEKEKKQAKLDALNKQMLAAGKVKGQQYDPQLFKKYK